MVTVSISETYDLHTVVNKMTLIGVHTPTKELIQKTYPGLCMNYKYFRIKSVDCVLSTAQQLPLGVDQIGLDTGQIRPQDMMNPILYKAVSNDSWSTLEARLNGLLTQMGTGSSASPPINGSMAVSENDGVTNVTDEHGVYYALLSNRDGFRAAHPQQGLSMKGLRPLVFEQWYSNGMNGADCQNPVAQTYNSNSSPVIFEDANANYKTVSRSYMGVMRGAPHPMPRINTTYLTGAGVAGESAGSNYQENGMGNGRPTSVQIQMPELPPVMLAAILLPPCTATTGILYYRMVCRTWIEFSEVRPITEISSFTELNSQYASLVYHSDYVEQSKNMDALTDMVDIKNGEIEKIMEGR